MAHLKCSSVFILVLFLFQWMPGSFVQGGFWSAPTTTTAASTLASLNELRLTFKVAENVAIGTFIGVIQSNQSAVIIEPPFLIVPYGDQETSHSSSFSSSSSAASSSEVSAASQQFDLIISGGQRSCNVDTDLNIDQSTGEIRSAVDLDRERCSHYSFIAISLTGVNIHVEITIDDVNDNVPQFPVREFELEFAENSRPKDVKRSLPPARDLDRGAYGTQSYRIISGNSGAAFRLISHREKDDILYLDLQVNGVLDRETTPNYRLVIEASDGGSPPLKDQLLVKINILDLNDNEPVFSQSHYYGAIAENATIGTSVLRVSATDADLGSAGQVSYSLYMKNSASGGSSPSDCFTVHPTTGVISVAKPLDFESQRLFELVVIAQDSGAVSLETSAFLSIRITDIADSLPTVNLLLLTSNSKPEVLESARVGDLIARVALNDAQGAETEIAGIELLGAEDDFEVKASGDASTGAGHLLTVVRPLDREKRPRYSMTIVLRDIHGISCNASVELEILDINDNAPVFELQEYHTTLPEAVDIGASVFQMRAHDADSDVTLTYAFLLERSAHDESRDEDDSTHPVLRWFNRHNTTHQLASRTAWFGIEPRSGLIVTRTQVDCETDAEPRLLVYVTDATQVSSFDFDSPALSMGDAGAFVGFSTTSSLIIAISDINDNEPIFDQSFYNVTVREDRTVGDCILQISATDPDCGVNALVNYSIASNVHTMALMAPHRHPSSSSIDFGAELKIHEALGGDFELNPKSGQLCIRRPLDFERQSLYDIPVLATDRGGLSTQAMIKIQVLDTNDNFPVFYPREYKVNVAENAPANRASPLVIVAATDKDSGLNGRLRYSIESGNDYELFDIESNTGEIFLVRPLAGYRTTEFRLIVGASDGGGLVSADSATVHISIVPEQESSSATLPVFTQRAFNFEITENCAQGSVVGVVRARIDSSSASQNIPIAYSIYSGDPDGYFAIDSRTGTISVRSPALDRERHSHLLLNVQANTGGAGVAPIRFAHTQVNISIIDENDNVPRFPATTMKLSVSESAENKSVIFVAQAVDRDTGMFGQIRYSLYRAEGHSHSTDAEFPFAIEEQSGKVHLRRKLDFESRSEYKLRVVAIDGGQLSSQMIVELLVQDANDNSPVFIGTSTASTLDISRLDARLPSRSLPLFKLGVVENAPINSPIHQLRAQDADTGNNARLTFSIEAISGGESHRSALPFDIFPNTGVLYVRDTLDRESRALYHALVHVHDHGAPHQLNASAVLQITIGDANDNRPQWKSIVYSFEIAEDAQIGALVGVVEATDADAGANSSLVYNLTDSSDAHTFRMNSQTGQIYLAEHLDREAKTHFEFVVEVKDLGSPSLASDERALVSVKVLDVNDNRPVFEFEGSSTGASNSGIDSDSEFDDSEEPENQSVVRIPIGTGRGSIVATFKAQDPDAGENGTVKYFLVERSDILEIDQESGALLTKVDIRESKNRGQNFGQEKVSIVAQDGGGKRSRPKMVEIELIDRKAIHQINLDSAPLYEFEIGAHPISPTFGHRVGVVDLPTGRKNPCGNRLFTNFNRQLKESVPFFVDSDEDKPSRLNLLVLDTLNRTHYSLLLCIDWSQCSTTLIPHHQQATYGSNSFSLHHLQLQCDHLTKISVSAVRPKNSHCNPLPLNSDAYDIKIPLVGVPESKTHLELLALNHSDCESVEYDLSSPSDDSALRLFSIVPIDGVEMLQFRLRDRTAVHELAHRELMFSLTARWSVGSKSMSRSVPLRVKILSADKRIGNIVFMSEKQLELEEDCCRVGAPIVQARINVSHDDFRIRYYLEHSTNDEQFILNPDSGLLSLKRELDFERRAHHQVNITAVIYDAKAPIMSVSQLLKIRVLNTNDESPIFDESATYSCEILENSSPGQLCLRLSATDADQQSSQSSSKNLTYLIAAGYEFSSTFVLDSRSGELTIVKTLDRERIAEYRVPVYVFDHDARHQAFKIIEVKVADVNDNPPRFIAENIDLRIPENILSGTAIASLIAEDRDNNTLKYRIVSGNSGERFTLKENRLSTSGQLDRETQATYQLVVEVSDGHHTASSTVNIELTDINDNAPVFEKSDYYAILDMEGAFGWLPVTTVRAIDSDGDKLLYMIDTTPNETPFFNLTKFFMINAETGEVSIHRSLIAPIFELLPTKRFSFEVIAVEAGRNAYQSHQSKTRIHLTLISDGRASASRLNPNGIKLSKYPFVIVAEHSRRSFRVGQEIGSIDFVTGSDQLKRSGFYQFRVLSGGESHRSFLDYFHLHSQTGAVSVKQPLGHNYYEAIIEVALTSGEEATRTLLQIFIGDVNKSHFVTPVLIEPFRVSESHSTGNELINLGRHIRSSSSRRQRFVLAYSNLKDFNSYLELKPQTGSLQLRKPLDYETQPSRIEIIAFSYSTSGPIHEHCHLFNFTIELTNVDDNQAQFTQSHYVGVVHESEQTGQIVGRVNAIDIDEPNGALNGSSKRFGYFIVEGNEDNAFSIGPDGTVRTNIVLDREVHEHYKLRIVATDMRASEASLTDISFLADEANYQHLTQCLLEVIVVDVNDNTPAFPPTTEISVSEDALAGTVVGSWTANDVDIHPVLTYTKKLDDDLANCFEIGVFTGRITLKENLSSKLVWSPDELVRPVQLIIGASDQVHSVETRITVNIKRNLAKMVPTFENNEKNFYISADLDTDFAALTAEPNVEVFSFRPRTSGSGRKILYRLENMAKESSDAAFYIDRSRGVIYNNRTIRSFKPSKLYQLAVGARYEDGERWARLTVLVNVERSQFGVRKESIGNHGILHTTSGHHQLEIDADQVGVPLLRLPKQTTDQYFIVGGNHNKNFMFLRGNELMLISRPLTDHYSLKIARSIHSPTSKSANSTMFVHIKIRQSSSTDAHAKSPFKSTVFELEINENERLDSPVQSLKFSHIGEMFDFELFAGNEADHFRVSPTDGTLHVAGSLDFETISEYRLGILARSQTTSQVYFAVVNVALQNVNEFCPRFPSNFFKAFIEENSGVGTRVMPIRAMDEDGDALNFTVTRLATGPQDDSSATGAAFRYDAHSGYLVVSGRLDYEQHHSHRAPQVHKFVVRASDVPTASFSSSGNDIHCSPVETLLEVQVGSVDEFPPQFSSESYHFKLTSGQVGSRTKLKIGQVEASDGDEGPDGRVVYNIKNVSPASLFDVVQINSTSGLLSLSLHRLRKKMAVKKSSGSGSTVLPKQFSLIISATSGRVNSLNSLAMVEVSVNPSLLLDEQQLLDGSEDEEEGEDLNSIDSDPLGAVHKDAALPGWLVFLTVLLLLVSVVLVVSIVVIRQAQQQQYLAGHYPPRPPGGHVGSLFRKIGPFGIGAGSSSQQIMEPNALSPAYSTAHYGNVGVALSPPCYNEIALSHGGSVVGPQGLVLSSATGHSGRILEQSSSSGRGSAEEEEVDEEIRMINESSNYYTTGPEESGPEEGEIPTTAEYLARLGVVNHYEEPENVSSLGGDDDDEQFSETVQRVQRPMRKKMPRPRVPSSYSQYGPSTSQMSGASSTAHIATGAHPVTMGSSMNSVALQHHNGEEIAGSYNWDYLQHWGPKYQPLSSVFAEIARLKASESGGSQQHLQQTLPHPLQQHNADLAHSIADIESQSIRSGSQHSSSTMARSLARPQPIVFQQQSQNFYELPPHHPSQQPIYQQYALQSQASSNSNYSVYGMTPNALQQIAETNIQGSAHHTGPKDLPKASTVATSSSSATSSIYNPRM